MVRKPTGGWARESVLVSRARTVAAAGAATTTAAGFYLRGLICWGLALLWGFAALAGGLLGGSLPTFVGVGALAALAAWSGSRMFARARG